MSIRWAASRRYIALIIAFALSAPFLAFEEMLSGHIDAPCKWSSGEKEGNDVGVVMSSISTNLYQNPSGACRAELYAKAVNYRDGSIWRGIDTSIEHSDVGPYNYMNVNNNFKTYFYDDISSGMAIEYMGSVVSMRLLGAHVSPATCSGNSVTYSRAFDGGDVRYTITSERVKEDIILEEYSGISTFAFALEMRNCTFTFEEGNYIFHSDGKRRFATEPLYMEDANGVRSTGVTLSIEWADQSSAIAKISADDDWLRAPMRAYPVRIDPTLVWQPDGATGKATYVYQGAPDTSYESDTKLIAGKGYSGVENEYCTLLEFPVSDLPANADVVAAELALYQVENVTSADIKLQTFPATSSWAEYATYNTRPAYTTTGSASFYVGNITYGDIVTVDLTEAVQAWYAGVPNYGICILSTAAATEDSYVCFTSDDGSAGFQPKLTVYYLSHASAFVGNTSAHSGEDAYVDSSTPSTPHGLEASLLVGQDGTGRKESYIKLNNALAPWGDVQAAYLRLYMIEPSLAWDAHNIELREATGAWNESTLTWGNQPGYSATSASTHMMTTRAGFVVWDVTSFIENWNPNAALRTAGDPGFVFSFASTEGMDASDPRAPRIFVQYATDGAAPSCSASVISGAKRTGYPWYYTDVVIRVSASDMQSGVSLITCSVNGVPYTTTNSYIDLSITSEGSNTVTYKARDVAGNECSISTMYVQIDKSAPYGLTASYSFDSNPQWWASGSSPVNLWYNNSQSSRTITFYVTNNGSDSYSGVYKLCWYLDGVITEDLTPASSSFPLTISAGNNETHDVRVYPVDAAGNTGSSRTFYVRRDISSPYGYSISGPSLVTDPTPYTISVSGATDGAAGAGLNMTYLDAFPTNAGTPYTNRSSMAGLTTEGIHYYRAYVTDRVGNSGALVSKAVTVDRTPPSILNASVHETAPTITVEGNTLFYDSSSPSTFTIQVFAMDNIGLSGATGSFAFGTTTSDPSYGNSTDMFNLTYNIPQGSIWTGTIIVTVNDVAGFSTTYSLNVSVPGVLNPTYVIDAHAQDPAHGIMVFNSTSRTLYLEQTTSGLLTVNITVDAAMNPLRAEGSSAFGDAPLDATPQGGSPTFSLVYSISAYEAVYPTTITITVYNNVGASTNYVFYVVKLNPLAAAVEYVNCASDVGFDSAGKRLWYNGKPANFTVVVNVSSDMAVASVLGGAAFGDSPVGSLVSANRYGLDYSIEEGGAFEGTLAFSVSDIFGRRSVASMQVSKFAINVTINAVSTSGTIVYDEQNRTLIIAPHSNGTLRFDISVDSSASPISAGGSSAFNDTPTDTMPEIYPTFSLVYTVSENDTNPDSITVTVSSLFGIQAWFVVPVSSLFPLQMALVSVVVSEHVFYNESARTIWYDPLDSGDFLITIATSSNYSIVAAQGSQAFEDPPVLTNDSRNFSFAYAIEFGATFEGVIKLTLSDASGSNGTIHFVVKQMPIFSTAFAMAEESGIDSIYIDISSLSIYYGPGASSFSITAISEYPLTGLFFAEGSYAFGEMPFGSVMSSGGTSPSIKLVYTIEAGSTFTGEITVVATDDFGRVQEFVVTVIRDFSPPTGLTIYAPSISDGSSYMVSALGAVDAHSGVRAVYLGAFYIDEGEPMTETSTIEGDTAEGTHYYRAVAIDNVGNRCNTSFKVIVDRTPPSLEIVSVISQSALVDVFESAGAYSVCLGPQGGRFTVTVKATDLIGIDDCTSTRVSGISYDISPISASNEFTIVYNSPNSTTGYSGKIEITVSDIAGKRTTVELSIERVVSAHAVENVNAARKGSAVIVTWTHPESTVEISSYEILRGNLPSPSARISTVPGTASKFIDSNATGGKLYYRVIAVDKYGNKGIDETLGAMVPAVEKNNAGMQPLLVGGIFAIIVVALVAIALTRKNRASSITQVRLDAPPQAQQFQGNYAHVSYDGTEGYTSYSQAWVPQQSYEAPLAGSTTYPAYRPVACAKCGAIVPEGGMTYFCECGATYHDECASKLVRCSKCYRMF